jgi:hypothetical protein
VFLKFWGGAAQYSSSQISCRAQILFDLYLYSFESLANRHSWIISNPLQFLAFRCDLFLPSDQFFFRTRGTFCSPIAPNSVTGSVSRHKKTFELSPTLITSFRRSTQPKTRSDRYQKNYESSHFRSSTFCGAVINLWPMCGRETREHAITRAAEKSNLIISRAPIEGSRSENVRLTAKQWHPQEYCISGQR